MVLQNITYGRFCAGLKTAPQGLFSQLFSSQVSLFSSHRLVIYHRKLFISSHLYSIKDLDLYRCAADIQYEFSRVFPAHCIVVECNTICFICYVYAWLSKEYFYDCLIHSYFYRISKFSFSNENCLPYGKARYS